MARLVNGAKTTCRNNEKPNNKPKVDVIREYREGLPVCWICVHCAVTENDMLRLLLNVLRNASSRRGSRWVTNM